MKSMQRVLRYDGLLPAKMKDDGSFAEVTLDDIQAMKAFIDEQRTGTTPFDIVVEGQTPGNNRRRAAAKVRPYAEAGATWWMEARWSLTEKMWTASGQKRILTRVKQGPPRAE